MEIDYQMAHLVLSIISLVMSSLTMVATSIIWFGNRGKATKDAIDRVESRAVEEIAKLDRRLIAIESDLRHAITKRDLEEIYQRLKNVGEATVKLEATTERMEDQLQNLLNEIQRRGLER